MKSSLELSPAEAAEEVLRRRGGRSSLIDFTTYTFPTYQAEAAHNLMASKLDSVARGETKRLMIFAPPQHGKSELASVRFPAYWLGRNPNSPIILTSYGSSLAMDKSRQIREVVRSGEYETLFPDRSLRADTQSVNLWRLGAPHRGGLLAAGVGGPVTGQGAGLGIIDDPVKDWEEAQSSTYRDKAWDWYKGTFRTRLWKDASVLLIMTRWHPDDLAGRLIESQGDKWEILRLPAIAEAQEERDFNNLTCGLPPGLPDPLGRAPGEALAPERYPIEVLEEIKEDVGSIVWAAEYQGSPRVAEGNRFKREWFTIVDNVPAEALRVRYWDLAGSEEKTSAWTVGLLMAMAPNGHFYVEDVTRVRKTPGSRNSVIRQVAEIDASAYGNEVRIIAEQEPGSSGKETMDNLSRLLTGFPFFRDRPTGNKDVRLEPFAAAAEAGRVFLRRGPWLQDYIEELVSIPNSAYRDQGDASSGAFNHLALKSRPSPKTGVVRRESIKSRFQ